MVQASPREIAVDISAKLADALEQLRVTRLRVRMLESELSASKADVTLCSSELGDLKANASRCWSQLGYGLLESKQKKYQESLLGHRKIASVALLVAVSTGRLKGAENSSSADLDFFHLLLPSFLETTRFGDGFKYSFYVAFDSNDVWFGVKDHRDDFETLFKSALANASRQEVLLHWVNAAPFLDGDQGPVRAWNAAIQEAASRDVDFFYQLGQDAKFVTRNWAGLLTAKLKRQNMLGVVGPRERIWQSDSFFIPYSFVSRSHLCIFGSFFPTQFHNWYADNWIMSTYRPFNLTSLVEEVVIENTHRDKNYIVAKGDRYLLQELVEHSEQRVRKYLLLSFTYCLRLSQKG